MACSNCYGGCTEITSDKCVKYTGVDVAVLGILNGDSLSFVEQALVTFLTSTLDGTGIKLTIDSAIICTLVNQYIPACEDLSALDLFKALIQAACDLQEQIDTINATLTTLNADYDIDCLSGVIASSDTHLVLQAVITKLCDVSTELTALAANISTNYVSLADLNSLIAAYLSSVTPVTQYNSRMIPYTIIPYFGSLSNFDGSGAGIEANGFLKIYLCNGANGTPDTRGRSPIGVIQGVGGGAMSSNVDPAFPGNTNYAILGVNGVNTVTLTTLQIPSHTHVATSVVIDPGHFHTQVGVDAANSGTSGDGARDTISNTGTSVTGITVVTTNASQGGGQSHVNVHPVIATYFICYIP